MTDYKMKIGFICSNCYAYSAFRRLVSDARIAEVSFVVGLDEERFAQSGMAPYYYQGSRFVTYASGLGIPALLTRGFDDDPEILSWCESHSPDAVFAMGWPDLLKPEVLRRLGRTIGVHPSKLPEYRGGAPLNWQFIDGAREIGVSAFEFSERVDAGTILAQRVYPTGTGNVLNFVDDVYEIATHEVLSDALDALRERRDGHVADVNGGFYRRRRKPADGEIDLALTSDEIVRFVRAQCLPFPGAFLMIDGRKIKIMDAKPLSIESGNPPADQVTIRNSRTILARSCDGYIELTLLRPIEGV